MKDISTRHKNQKLEMLRDPHISDNVLRELSLDSDSQIRCEVINHPNISEDVLREWAKDKTKGNEDNRRYIAYSLKTPVDVLRDLAKDSYWFTRANVARNSNTPQDTLKELSTDKEPTVRSYVAKNPKSSGSILIKVLEYEKRERDPSNFIINDLYKNPNLPLFAKRIIETLYGKMIYWI